MAQMFKFVRVHVRKYPVSEVEDGGGGEHQDRYSAAKADQEAGKVNPDQSLVFGLIGVEKIALRQDREELNCSPRKVSIFFPAVPGRGRVPP